MPTSSQWIAFLIASILFIQVPGPSLLFTIGRALTVGRREALLSVVGNGTGLVVQALTVALGLGAILAASASAFTVVKVVGGAYVVWLGIQAIRHRADARAAMEDEVAALSGGGATVARPAASASLRIGFLVGLTNPKTVLFFIAFLPQFTNAAAGHVAAQTALLGLAFGALAVCSDSIWALVAGRARTWLARTPKRLDQLGAAGGTMMVGLGVSIVVRN
ncbi:LysE family translocator [Ornithinimicrobium ciconiae]|uniref:LysE family translocator n=1 Tax=Ornithinimicrobium ciconiae TaxID=2594265 RepID=A0A516G7X3_9MICO|nr:LysE family translocator [Ornithinimicrobium ciconiae]QDO87460.1 LysE family translocator [Ornithinimicrobium ciconiae]